MFGAIKTCSRGNQPFRQMFTATQAARALRPFYFAVHPDLFGSHPEIRSINEESLKVLNGYLDGLFCAPLRLPQPVTLTFFVRPSKIAATASTTSCASFRRVQLQLNTGDACDAVRRVLEEFQLSTEDLQPSRNQRHSGNNSSVHPVDWQFFYKMYRSNLDPFNSAYQQQHQQMWQSFGRTKKKPTPKPTSLTEALSQYAKDSATLTRREAAIKADIKDLTDVLCQQHLKFVVADIQWLSSWASLHRKSVLKTLLSALNLQPDVLPTCQQSCISSDQLTLVFSNFSYGLCANGSFVLAQDEVPQNWLLALRHIQSLKTVGLFDQIQRAENRLSSYLVRRIQFQRPARTKAVVYLQNLRNLNLGFAQLNQADPDQLLNKHAVFTVMIDGSDSDFHISHTGVIHIPVGCHPSALLAFLESAGPVANLIISRWANQQELLNSLKSQCDQLLKTTVRWDSDQPNERDMIIGSLQRLINSPPTNNRQLLDGTSLVISHQSSDSATYSVLDDGSILVPRDWTI